MKIRYRIEEYLFPFYECGVTRILDIGQRNFHVWNHAHIFCKASEGISSMLLKACLIKQNVELNGEMHLVKYLEICMAFYKEMLSALPYSWFFLKICVYI